MAQRSLHDNHGARSIGLIFHISERVEGDEIIASTDAVLVLK